MRIIIALAFFSQWSGNGLVSYYLNKVFDTIGITDPTIQLLINGILQIWNLAWALLASSLCDKAGRRVLLKEVGLFADGAAVKTVGEETFRICQEVVDEVVQVTTDETCAAIKDMFEDTRSIVEPAGALALAGPKKWVSRNPSPDRERGLVAIASGANMNFDRLRFVAERAALGENKEALLSVTIPEMPGAFA